MPTRVWHPPPGTKAVLGVEGDSVAKVKALYKKLGLTWKQHAHVYLRLDDPRLPRLTDAIDSSARGLRLSAAWLEEPPPKPSDPTAWFDLGTGSTEFRSAAKAPKGLHFADRDRQHLASEAFLEAVRAAGLTGLAVLPLAESRPDDPMRWYEVFAEHPIGRGLDHPLLDPQKHERQLIVARKKMDQARRWGEPVAWLTRMKDTISIEQPVVLDLIRLGPTHIFRVAGPSRFVREHLPPGDFAYRSWGISGADDGGAGGRWRHVCCNARARQVLIDAGVMKPTRFGPLATVPAANAEAQGCIILDRAIRLPLPPPTFTPAEAAAEQARREAAVAAAATSTARPRLAFASIDEAAAYLERRLADGTATWTPARDTAEFDAIRSSALFSATPHSWQRLAPLLPLEVCAEGEADSDPGMDLELAEPQWNDWLGYDHDPDDPPDPDETPSTDDLIIATTPFGDWYALRKTDPGLPADARITHWDHETALPADQWPTVAAFAAAIIEAADRSAANT